MGKTTREQLNSYKSKKAEIKELQYKLDHLGEGDSMICNDTIFDYRTGYPKPQAVVGIDWEKYDRLKSKYCRQLDVLTADCEEVELWIEDISDSLTRRIFRMYFTEGLSQKEVATFVNLDRSRISRKIDDFLKNAHKAQKAHV